MPHTIFGEMCVDIFLIAFKQICAFFLHTLDMFVHTFLSQSLDSYEQVLNSFITVIGNFMVTVASLVQVFGLYQFHMYLISDSNRKILVMIGTLLYVFGSCERHVKLTEHMHILLRLIPKEEDTLRC